jgi:membrane dipeptidase
VLDAVPNYSATRFDGLVVRSDGWTDGLAASGLRGIHVTAADWVGDDFATAAVGLAEWNRILDEQADRFFAVRCAEDVALIGEDPRLGVVLGLQNAEPIGDEVRRVRALWDLGVRVLQLTYNGANLLADGCTEVRDWGLSALGRRVVAECNRLGVLLDLSHLGHRSSLDIAGASSAPVAVTHANRHALVGNPRNKHDDVLRAVAGSGGVIGVTPWAPMCWRGGGQPGVEDFVAQLVSVIELVGIDAVGIGTDLSALTSAAPGSAAVLERSVASHPEIFAEYVSAVANTIETRYCLGLTSIDTWAGLPSILANAGFDPAQSAQVLGGNWLRLFGRTLPMREATKALATERMS